MVVEPDKFVDTKVIEVDLALNYCNTQVSIRLSLIL